MESLTGAVPRGWAQVQLGDVCDILADPSGARLRIEQRTPANVPVVAPQDFRNNRINDSNGAVSATLARELSRYRIQPDDVICARTGTLGRQALASERQDGWLLGTGCLRVRPQDQVNPRYLIYYLGHRNVHDWITRSGAASTIPSLSTKTLKYPARGSSRPQESSGKLLRCSTPLTKRSPSMNRLRQLPRRCGTLSSHWFSAARPGTSPSTEHRRFLAMAQGLRA